MREFDDDRVMRGQPKAAAKQSQDSAYGSSNGDYRSADQYRRRYRHMQKSSAARQATFLLAGLVLIVPGDASATVAILAPLSSGGSLLILVKLFFFSSTVKVVN